MHRFLTAALALGLAAGPAAAEWVALAPGASRAPTLFADGRPDAFALELEVPGLEVTREGAFSLLRIPGHAFTNEAGYPELPVVTTSVLLPDEGAASVRLEVLEEEAVQLEAPVAPARGKVTRDVPLSSVPRQPGPVYASAGFYPGEDFPVQLSSPYVLRDVRGASLRVVPVVYEPATGTLRVLKRARVIVEVAPSLRSVNARLRSRRQSGVSKDFMALYKSLFINFPVSGFGEETLDETSGRAIIITPDEWVETLQPLLDWRETKGLPTKVLPLSETGSSTSDLRAAIQAEYEAGDLTYVLFVGDADKIPALKGENEGADCDACYLFLEGNDFVPDAFISRFSATTAEEVAVQVNRAVTYEKTPVLQGAFYRKATGIASNEGTPKDYERMNDLWDALKAFRMDEIDRLYDPDSQNWPGLKDVQPEQVVRAVNEGRTVINYMGHGSKTAWVTSNFGVQHIEEQLTNDGGQWPMIWSVACVNGDFVHGSDCFGEAWAKAGTPEAPKGAIGIVAASTNMAWHPPVDWQKAVITEYMIPEQVFTGGALHHYALVKAMEKWGNDASSDGVQMVEQCIFFGDSSVVLRNDLPRQAAFTVTNTTAEAVELKVAVGEKPVKAARVVCRMGDQVAVAVTGEDGVATLPAMAGEAGATLTITGPNLVPILDQPMN